jgi:cysteine-rich repeat protein
MVQRPVETGFLSAVFIFALSLGLFWAPSSANAAAGNVLSEQKISSSAGCLAGPLTYNDRFGVSTTGIGDLDGDMLFDIAVGANLDDDGGSDRGAVWVLFLDGAGSVLSEQKISDTSGLFGGSLDDDDHFGMSVSLIGDLDNDGNPDIVVGACGDDDGGTDRGAVWVLFLNSNGTVKGQQKISDTVGGLGASLSNGDEFGCAVAGPGDIDGDLIPDIVVGAPADDDGGTDRGATYLLFMNANGTVKSEVKISDATPGFGGSLSDGDRFGSAATRMGDIDSNGTPDIVIGARLDDDGGTDRGAVWVLRLDNTGALVATQKISDTAGGFTGTLNDSDHFGASVGFLRDLNGDGQDDLAVGADGDDDGGINHGAIWVLFLDNTGLVTLRRKISSTVGGFTGPLSASDFFGSAASSPRDINGDGIADLIGGAHRDDDGGSNRGAVYVLMLDGIPGAFCGDGFLDPGEDCDDGNNDPGDCCSPTCTFDIVGTSCANATVCDGDETCDGAGTCLAGTPLDCDDGEPCTQDLCDPILGCMSTSGPAPVCLFSLKGKISVKDDAGNNAKDVLKWKWLKGEETLLSDFGSPTASTEYVLCVYDETASVPSLATTIPIPAGVNWFIKGSKGFKYKDKTAANAGVKNITLKSGDAGKAKIVMTAKGTMLPTPPPVGANVYFSQDTTVTVQMLNDLGMCWSVEFDVPAKKNDGVRFQDKLP